MEKDLLSHSHRMSSLSGKESDMAELAHSTSYLVRALEVQAIARMIMSYNHDQDLIEKVTVLQEYLDLATMYPDNDYEAVIRKASTELIAVIQSTLNCDLLAVEIEQKRMALFETSRAYAEKQGLLVAD
jgi:hypothetical protein